MNSPQELAEVALAASHADGCIVLIEEHSETNLRWAGSSMTTNGHATARTMTVISVHEHAAGPGVGVLSRSVATPAMASELVRAADSASRDCDPIEDWSPLVEPYRVNDLWHVEVSQTSRPDGFEDLASQLAVTMGRWHREDRLLFGFAEHQVTAFFLASSTGLRRRFDQEDGRFAHRQVARPAPLRLARRVRP